MHFFRILITSLAIFFSRDIYSQSMLDSSKINDIYIRANKFKERKKNIAAHIQVLTAKTIKNTMSQNTGDILSHTGLAYVQRSQQGGGSPIIRGYEASRILLTIDGVRMNNAIYRSGHLQNIITTDPFLMESIEIINGPASTLYGSDALGGVILMHTRDVKLAKPLSEKIDTSSAVARYSSVNNERSIHGEMNIAGTRFGSLTSVTMSKFGDMMSGKNGNDSIKKYWTRPFYVAYINGKDSLIVKNPYLQKNSGYNVLHLTQKFLWNQNKKNSHLINLQYSTSNDIPRTDRLQEISNAGIPIHAEWYYGPQLRNMIAYQLNHTSPYQLADEISIQLNWQGIEESRYNRRYNNSTLQRRIENLSVYGYGIMARKKIRNNEFTYGLDGQYNTLKSTANKINIQSYQESKLDTRYPDGSNHFFTHSFFMQHIAKLINNKLVLNDGIRYSMTSLHSTLKENQTLLSLPYNEIKQKNSALTGNIGLVYSGLRNLRICGNIAGGFRAPNIDDAAKVFESVVGKALIVPNPKLKAEFNRTVDLCIDYQNKKWLLEAVAYTIRGRNTIIIDKYSLNGQDSILYDQVLTPIYAAQNKSRTRIYGLNMQGKYLISPIHSVFAQYQLNNGIITTSNVPMDHIPPGFGMTGYRYNRKKLFTECYIQFNQKKKLSSYSPSGEDNLQYATPDGLPSWWTFNLKSSYEVNPHIQLQAGIENIFDRLYRTFASGYNAPGRNFILSVRVQ